MEEIISRVDRRLVKAELENGKFVRYTNNGDNEIYIITAHDSPHTMQEIGRLREVTFRHAGGGTGKSVDIDAFDVSDHPYKQLIVWNPEDEEIVGAYRYIVCRDAAYHEGKVELATTELFNFSPLFYEKYLPYTIELGRSFVQPMYQPAEHFRKGIFSLDNLWDGLGAVVVENPEMRHFFGKMTMYTHYNREARDMILAFLQIYFPDKEDMVTPIIPVKIETDVTAFLDSIKGMNYKDAHAVLNKRVRERGENIPPLVNTYMNTSPTMKSFGTAINPGFGGVEETGLMITFDEVYPTKRDRHINSYIQWKESQEVKK